MDTKTLAGSLTEKLNSTVASTVDAPTADVAALSMAIHRMLREVGRELLQHKVDLLREELRAKPGICKCGRQGRLVHTRTVTQGTLHGEIKVPVRTFRCEVCEKSFRPDDRAFGLPEAGLIPDDVAAMFTPVVAELPVRVATELFKSHFGIGLSFQGAQRLVDRTADGVREWRLARENEEAAVIAQEIKTHGSADRLSLEVAVDGVMAHIDGGWREVKVGTVTVRRRAEPPGDGTMPRLGPVLGRRHCCVLGAPFELGLSMQQVVEEVGWDAIPVAQVQGDGAPWIWKLFDDLYPGAPQVLDWYHLSTYLYAFATSRFGETARGKAAAKRWVHRQFDRLVAGRLSDVLSALKRTKTSSASCRESLDALIGYLEANSTRVDYGRPKLAGLAVGSGNVEAACKYVIQTRFKRTGMRWKEEGFLNVLELRLAKLNGTLARFWQDRFACVGIERAA